MSAVTDAAMLDRAEEYRDLKAEISRLEGEAKRVGDELLAMLAARGETSAELSGGWKVAALVNTSTIYDLEAATAAWPRSVLRKVVVRSIDRKLVDTEIEAGRLGVLEAKAAGTVKQSAPYPRVTPPKKKKAA